MSDQAYPWPLLLRQLLDRQSLRVDQATELMQAWLTGAVPPEVSAGILVALEAKGVNDLELTAMARVLQSPPPPGLPSPRVDTCGTGGDGQSTFNISTAVAFVTAAAGIPVIKHGNRSASGRVGSADVLEALGVPLEMNSDQAQAALGAVGITFLFAPGWHPALKNLAPVRRTLGIRTVFNLLGPLVNPFHPTGQVLGVSNPRLLTTMAQALGNLGVSRGIVLHGRENLDEAGLGGLTDLVMVEAGTCTPDILDPRTLGLTEAPTIALAGGDLGENSRILRAVLQGQGSRAQREAVALNASLALQVGGVVPLGDHRQGLGIAFEVLGSGSGWGKLEQLVEFLAPQVS